MHDATDLSALPPPIATALGVPNRDAMLAQVQHWAATNSGSRNMDGLSAVANAIADAMRTLPGQTERIAAAPVDSIASDGSTQAARHGDHLVHRVRPAARLRMLFTGHMDTVFGIDHPFQQQRWLDDDTLNGPGVADMKGGIAVMLAALQAVEASGMAGDFGYDILINSDEEVGSPSSAALIASLAQGKIAALTYEPSALPDGTLAHSRAGSGNFSLIVQGRSAHAGRNPDDGRNALVAAADLALRLKAAHRPGLSVNPARIDGGSPNNVVPDQAILRVNFRPLTLDDEQAARQLLDAVIAQVAAQHDVHIHLHGNFGRPPKPVDPTAQRLFDLVRQCGADLGLDIGWISSGGVCDGNNIAACGIPVVDTMGVRGGNIHSADEFMIVSSLVERAQLSALTILRIIEKGGV